MNRSLYIVTLSIAVLLLGCKKPDVAGIDNLNRNTISAIGHGGMGITSSYPINTYESLQVAFTAGADGVEIDVQMTSDSVLVTYHNDELSTNTGCSGKISDHTWVEIKDCEYDNSLFAGYEMWSVSDLMGAWKDKDSRIIVFDCKLIYSSNFDEFQSTYARQIVKLVESIEFGGEVLIESQSIDFLLLIQAQKPDYKLFFYPQTYEEGFDVAFSNNLYGITIASSKVTKQQIREAHDNGLRVAIWNIDSRSDNVDAINKYPDYIQTDKLKNLLGLLE